MYFTDVLWVYLEMRTIDNLLERRQKSTSHYLSLWWLIDVNYYIILVTFCSQIRLFFYQIQLHTGLTTEKKIHSSIGTIISFKFLFVYLH